MSTTPAAAAAARRRPSARSGAGSCEPCWTSWAGSPSVPAPPTLLALLELPPAAADEQVRARAGGLAVPGPGAAAGPAARRARRAAGARGRAARAGPGRGRGATWTRSPSTSTEHLRPRVRAAVLVEDRLVADDHAHLLDEAADAGWTSGGRPPCSPRWPPSWARWSSRSPVAQGTGRLPADRPEPGAPPGRRADGPGSRMPGGRAGRRAPGSQPGSRMRGGPADRRTAAGRRTPSGGAERRVRRGPGPRRPGPARRARADPAARSCCARAGGAARRPSRPRRGGWSPRRQRQAGIGGGTQVRALSDEVAAVLVDAERRWAGRRRCDGAALRWPPSPSWTSCAARRRTCPRAGEERLVPGAGRGRPGGRRGARPRSPAQPGRRRRCAAVLADCPDHPGASAALAAAPVLRRPGVGERRPRRPRRRGGAVGPVDHRGGHLQGEPDAPGRLVAGGRPGHRQLDRATAAPRPGSRCRCTRWPRSPAGLAPCRSDPVRPGAAASTVRTAGTGGPAGVLAVPRG